jgi:hypothetical protein
LLNGNERSTLLEEKRRESIAIYRTTLRPSQWKFRLIVTRHKFPSLLAGRRTLSSRGVLFFTTEFLLTTSVSLGYNIKKDLN